MQLGLTAKILLFFGVMVTITIGNFGILLLAENHSGALKNHLLQSHQVIRSSKRVNIF
ncbi:MAG: hypothetical protein HOI61_01235 [Gammaproteobacteria bacterium]|nr:hypothetical protein [Gammaproteobacteria bacterium]MBT3489995.1 hypothetical protein [Gammaproteobacteria bacterium]MBT3892004.1 hypothetical protein [Gammaproteobacteria bacterium]MBT4301560.1 hypothetical protein [Gammaproteobacteria bacterium]MBT4548022.1 hypothetical protein [Gammaproteobacteria bacterium]